MTDDRIPNGGKPVTGVLTACASLFAALGAFTLHDLQTRLERWDYDRHAND